MSELRIGGVTLRGNVTLAPMAGYGDRAFRRLCREYGAALTTTEMVSVKGLCYGNEKTEELLRLAPNESPSCVQLFGSDPLCFAQALRSGQLDGFDLIDVNMGCPVPKVTKNGEGSALMRDVPRAAAIAAACVKHAGGRPVTVKFRLGWDEAHANATAFARAMQDSGAAAVTVHGRYATQLYRGTADWDAIAAVAAAVDIPVVGNGDVSDRAVCARRLRESGCAGIAVGRGALGRPWIFGGQAAPLADVIARHLRYMREDLPDGAAVHSMRKHLAYYFKGVPDCRQLRQDVNAIEEADELLHRIRETLGGRTAPWGKEE